MAKQPLLQLLNGVTRFGRLTVIGEGQKYRRDRRVICRCDCGRTTIVRPVNLRKGYIQSCGCYGRDARVRSSHTHGGTGTRLHRIWKHMRARCNNASDSAFHQYGGRGITVCRQWNDSFANFQKWALANGYDDGLSIDRIDNDDGYSPENCRWTDQKTQNRNRRDNVQYTYRGKTACLTEHAERARLNAQTVWSRINRLGWSLEKALETR